MTVHCGDESEIGDQLQDIKRYDTNGLLPEMSMKLVSYYAQNTFLHYDVQSLLLVSSLKEYRLMS